MKSVKELIDELQELKLNGVEFIEFVDEHRNSYYFKEVEQSGAKEFGYIVLETEDFND